MKRDRVFAFFLIAISTFIYLYFSGVSVTAEEVTINNVTEYCEVISEESNATEIVLGSDIDISSLSTEENKVFINSNMTLDLNGHKLTVGAGNINLCFYGEYIFMIKDSSELKSGLIYTLGDAKYTSIYVVSSGDFNTNLVLEDISFDANEKAREIVQFGILNEGYSHKLAINGTFFNNARALFLQGNKNVILDINIISMYGTNVSFIHEFRNYRIYDILDGSTRQLVVNGEALDPNIIISTRNVSGEFEVRLITGFQIPVLAFFDVKYGYSNVDTKPLAIKNAGSSQNQIKSVIMNDPNFSLYTYGSAQPIIEAGSTNDTSFKIKPVNGLGAGTHKAIVYVTDMNDEISKGMIFFVVDKLDINPEISIDGWAYGETPKTPSVTGNIGNAEVTYEYKSKDADDSTYETTVPTNVGEYIVRATVAPTDIYNGSTATTNFSITKNTFSEIISYTQEVRANVSRTYYIYISDLGLPLGFTNAKMNGFTDETYTNGIFQVLEIQEGGSRLCIITNMAGAEKIDTLKLEISSDNYEDKNIEIAITTVPKETVTISGLTYANKTYDNAPIVSTGELSYGDYVGTIDVLYESTDGKGYSSSVAPKDAGTYKVTYSIPDSNEDYTGNKVYTFEIFKLTPIYTIPSGLESIEGNTLSSVSLPSGFTWNDGNAVLVEGNNNYIGTFTPSDSNNYETIVDVSIPVYVKAKHAIITSVDGGNGTISDGASVVDKTDYEITFSPATGYIIDTVKINGVLVTVTSNMYNIANITEDKTVVVKYKKILALNINDSEGATITPNGNISVAYGDNKIITITANYGYKLISVKVNGIEKLSTLVDNKLNITNIICNTTILVVAEKIVYEVVEGANQEYKTNKDNTISFKCDGDFTSFDKVYINDELVDSSEYEVETQDNTIIFKKSYLQSLNKGTYSLKLTYTDGGEATTEFVISVSKENTKTGVIVVSIIGSIILLGFAGVGTFVLVKRHNKVGN